MTISGNTLSKNTFINQYKLACQGMGYIFCDIPQFTMIAFDFLDRELGEFSVDFCRKTGYTLKSEFLRRKCEGDRIEDVLLLAVEEVIYGKL